MVIDTGLSVPIFNVVKYILMFILFDTIVRLCLEEIRGFLRKTDLRKNRLVPLSDLPLDRFALLSTGADARCIRSIHTRALRIAILVGITLVAYAVEAALEFSTDSVVHSQVTTSVMEVVSPMHRTCDITHVIFRYTAVTMKEVADACVVIDGGVYRLYSPVWKKEGPLIYGHYPYAMGSHEERSLAKLRASMAANILGSKGNQHRVLLPVEIANTDIFANRTERLREGMYKKAVFIKSIPNTPLFCFGNVYGRFGEGQIKIQMMGCLTVGPIDESDESVSHFFFMKGTGVVFTDAELMTNINWKVVIAAEESGMLYDFARNILDLDSWHEKSKEALAAYYGMARSGNHETINRNAVVYKHCSKINVTIGIPTGEKRIMDTGIQRNVTVSISGWAIAVIVSWPVCLSILACALLVYGKHKKLPSRIQGEECLARMWLLEKRPHREPLQAVFPVNDKTSTNKQEPKQILFSVELGEDADSITIGGSPKSVQRDLRKPIQHPLVN